MKKKVFLLFTLIFISTLIFVGCSESSKEILTNSFEKSNEINSQKTSLEMSMNIDGGALADDPETQLVMSMFNNINMKVDSKIEDEKSESKMRISMAGIAIEGEIFTDGEVVAVRYPLFGPMLGIGDKYILTTVEDMAEEDGGQLQLLDNNEMFEITKLSRESLLSQVTDDEIVVNKDVQFEIPDGSITATEYVIDLPDNKTIGFMKHMVKGSLDNEILRDKTVQYLKQQALSMGIDVTDEDIKSNPDKIIDDIYKSEDTDFLVNMKLILDDDRYIRGGNISFELTTLGTEAQDEVKLTMNLDQKVWSINDKIEFETPEFTEENSIQLDEINSEMVPMAPVF